jgi:hypothetical protein
MNGTQIRPGTGPDISRIRISKLSAGSNPSGKSSSKIHKEEDAEKVPDIPEIPERSYKKSTIDGVSIYRFLTKNPYSTTAEISAGCMITRVRVQWMLKTLEPAGFVEQYLNIKTNLVLWAAK